MIYGTASESFLMLLKSTHHRILLPYSALLTEVMFSTCDPFLKPREIELPMSAIALKYVPEFTGSRSLIGWEDKRCWCKTTFGVSNELSIRDESCPYTCTDISAEGIIAFQIVFSFLVSASESFKPSSTPCSATW